MNDQTNTDYSSVIRTTTRNVNFGWIREAYDLYLQQAIIWIIATAIILFGPSIAIYPFSLIINAFNPPTFMLTTTGAIPSYSPVQFFAWWIKILPWEGPLFVITGVLQAFLMTGALRMAIRQVRGQVIGVGDLFSGWPNTGRVFLLGLMLSVGSSIIICPLVLLAVQTVHGTVSRGGTVALLSGFVVLFLGLGNLLCMLFPAYVLTADGVPLLDSLARTFKALKHDWIRATGFFLLYDLIYTTSCLPCLLGLFVTAPMGVLILALVYRDLLGLTMPVRESAGKPAFTSSEQGY